MKLILITGGAGFIGSHLTDALLERGYRVRIFDNFDPQIHPNGKPDYLHPAVECIEGDVRDRAAFQRALEGVDAVFHFAAAVGTGQSMYQIEKYAAVNIGGLSNLLDILVETGARPKIIFPGSATSYGECAHSCPEHGIQFPELRSMEQLAKKDFDVHCSSCGRVMTPVPIPERQPLRPKFVYGIHKKSSEELLAAVAETYNIPYTILRFFNVYGPRQSLSNPYTGVIAIFSSRIKNGNVPQVIEDGKESRDFISVYDIVAANVLALEQEVSNGKTYNVGTGTPTNILSMAKLLLKFHHVENEPIINGEYRKNDFRHSIADISAIRADLGFSPTVDFATGLHELFEWSKTQASVDNFSTAMSEMKKHGILSGAAEPRIAVVTLNWNGFDKTVECIDALLASTHKNLKIAVVDNGSKNDEAKRLQERYGSSIEVLAMEKNLGVAAGNNAGLHHVLQDEQVEYVVMMNNDLLVEPRSIERLVAPALANEKIGMVASRMMNYYRRTEVDNLGIAVTTTGLGYNRKTESYPLFCPCSGFGLYRASALRDLRQVHGHIWDDQYFAYVDEVDVGFRLRLRGYTAAYAPEGVAYHMDGATSGGPQSDFSIFHGHRNNVWFILKDYPRSILWKNIFGIIATQFGTFLLYAKRKRLQVILKAKFAALRGASQALQKRASVQSSKTVQDSEIEKFLIRKAYITPESTTSTEPTI